MITGNRTFPKNIMSHLGQGEGYSTTSTIRAIYGSVPFEKVSNLHVGLSGAKSRRKGGSGARCSAASPLIH